MKMIILDSGRNTKKNLNNGKASTRRKLTS